MNVLGHYRLKYQICCGYLVMCSTTSMTTYTKPVMKLKVLVLFMKVV